MEQKYFITGIILLLCSLAFGQGNPSGLPADISNNSQSISPTITENYILTRSYLKEFSSMPASLKVGDLNCSVQYFDGLGRIKQEVSVSASPVGKDILIPHEYDQYDREVKKYLPYTKSASGNNGAVTTLTTAISEQNTFLTGLYGSTDGSKGFSETAYESSPRNRINKQGSPGTSWQLTDHPVNFGYKTNTSSIGSWKCSGYTFSQITFNEGTLDITETTDADGKVVVEYKDKEGKLIQQEMNGAVTKYCYDEFGQLRCVVQPMGTSPGITNYCFFYDYDKRRRLTAKKLPGGDWIYSIYDVRNRLVLQQDANQRSKSPAEWSYFIYDDLNRPKEQGTWATSTARSSLTTIFESVSNLNYMVGQTRAAMKYNHYDNYTNLPAAYNFYTSDATTLGVSLGSNNKDWVCWTETKAIDSEVDMDIWITRAMYYDKYGRLIQTVADNHLLGKDYITSKYNFADQNIRTFHRHVADGNTTTLDQYSDYDHRGRLVKNRYKINGGAEILMAANVYNEAGIMVDHYQHSESGGNFLQRIDYDYNIMGWLAKIDDPVTFSENDKFGLQLYYNTAPTGGSALYNGNISGMKWGTALFTDYLYRFTYDGNNRLTNADFNKTGLPTSAYDETCSYDANGNILGLMRFGNTGGQIDYLNYTYYGNRISTISDFIGDVPLVEDYPGNTNAVYFSYDANRNMIYEPSKGITISYNLLNLPKELNFGSNKKINYFYNFDGEKQRQVVENNGTLTKVDYCGPFVYETASGVRSLKFFTTSEGRALKNGSIWDFEYNLKDHLGNVRTVIRKGSDGLAEVVQEKHYYAFGLEMSPLSRGSSTNKYLYNGKEYQNDLGLGWYDYGARFYDPAIGRWHSVDPLAEVSRRWSPYTYCYNNPMGFIDPDGMAVYKYKIDINSSGAWVETDKSYSTDNPDEIAKFFLNLFGIGPGNQPENAEQAHEQSNARQALSNVGDKIETLYGAEQEAISYLPGGVLLNGIINSHTGYEGNSDFATYLGFEAAGIFLPGVKFAKGPLKNVVKLSDNIIEFTQGTKELAKRVTARLPEGFTRVKGLSKQQKIFTNGNVFISPDETSHIGGIWKAANKIEHLGSKAKRLGTYDENFVKIGD